MEEIADDSHVISGDPSPIPPPPPAKSSSAPTSWFAEEDDGDGDDEGDMCRICRGPAEPDNPLSYPCACGGSMKFVHQPCLLQWLDHRKDDNCEVCKHAFSFSAVYTDNIPATLPFKEFAIGLVTKACCLLQFSLCFTCSLSFWIFRISLVTVWMWRLSFARSFDGAHRLFLSHLSPRAIVVDCVYGFILSAIVWFAFLQFRTLRNYLTGLRDPDRNGALQIIIGTILYRFQGDVLIHRNYAIEQFFDGFDDDDEEEVFFLELIGVDFPVLDAVKDAIAMTVCNAMFFTVGIFIPFSLGGLILYYQPLPVFVTSYHAWSTSFYGLPSASDVITLGIAYIIIIFMFSIYLGLSVLVRYTKGEHSTITIQFLFRHFLNKTRHLMNTLKCIDLCNIVRALRVGAMYSMNFINMRNARVLVWKVWKECITISLLYTYVIVISVLIGFLYELAILPVWIPVEESLLFVWSRWGCLGIVVHILPRCWCLGLLHLIIGTLVVYFGDESWQSNLDKMIDAGPSGFRVLWTLQELMAPLFLKLLIALCMPYACARGLSLGYGYPLIVITGLNCLLFPTRFCIERCRVWFDRLHESIRDDRYLLGIRLNNFDEDGES